MKKIAGLASAVLCGLCACFLSCNPDAGEEVRVFYPTYNSDGTIGSSGLSQSEWESLLASIQGESTIVLSSDLTSADLITFAKALIASGKTGIKLDLSNLSIVSIASETFLNCTAITSIVLPETVVSIGKDAFSGCTSLTLVTYGGTMDDWGDIAIDSGNEYLTGATIVCSDGKMIGYIYETVTASYSGSGTNALSGYTFAVTYRTGISGNITISKVVASISGSDTQLSGSDGVYTLSVTGVGGYEALYTITFVYSSGAVSYTYTVTAVEDAEATGGLSAYGVHVKYTSSGGSYTVQALAVDDGENPVTLSANSDSTYTYTVGENGLYTSDEDSVATTYTITLVTKSAPSYTYTYTYVKTTTADYTATGGISDTTITANATVTETYNGSSSTYTVDSLNSVTIAGDEVSANSDGTYTYTVDSGSTTTVYTITLTASTSGGVSYTYTYDSVGATKYTAKGGLSYTVTVYYNSTDSKIEQVTVADDTITYTATEDEDTSGVYTVTISGAEYTVAISGSASAGYTYTTTLTATGSLSQTVQVTVDSGGTITAVTVGGTQATVSGSSATVTIDSVAYTLTISDDFTSYSYTATFTATYSGTSSAFSAVTVTVSSGEITAVTADGTACTLQDDGTYLCMSGDMTYFITISGGNGSYSYSYDEYFGTSSTDYDGFVSLLSSLSSGCTIVLYPYLTTAQLEWFADALTESSLSSVTVDMSYMTITQINDETFSGCTKITSVILPSSLETIGDKAFYECTKITSVILPSSVTTIGSCAFESCTSLTSIEIPDSVTSIGSSAFLECTSLETVVIGDGVKTIGFSAFWDCTSLTEVTIGSGVTTISSYAFANCSRLATVYYNGSKNGWNSITISSTGNSYLTSATINYTSSD